MNILALDTSSTSGSIAIAISGKISYLSYLDIAVTHSQRLMPQIDLALNQSKIKVSDLDLIVLGNGPGSFTGIRIGLATAKGICLGLKIPLIAYNTLDILRFNEPFSSYPVAAFIDARMGEIYGSLYDTAGNYLIEPCNAKPEDFLEKVTEPTLFIGDGALKYKDLILAQNQENKIALLHQHLPLASTIIAMTLHKDNIPEYNFEFISELEPYYLRKSQAELVKLATLNK